MKNKRKIALVLVMVFVMSLLTACGGLTEEDAQNYVQAVLDASYKGEFDAYIEETGSTKEEAEEMFNKNVEETLSEAGFDDFGLDEELIEKYKSLFVDLAKLANYEITDVSKNDDDNFIVEVTVKPLDFMSGVEEEATEILTDELLKMTEFPSDDELMKLTFDLMYDLVAEKVENPTYGDATTVVLRLEVNEENEYEINEDDFVALDNSLYSSEY